MTLRRCVPARAVLVAVLWAAAVARPLAARQQDTIPPPPDTAAAAQDTVLPPPVLVPWPARRGGGEPGVWTWDRDSLARAAAYSVLDLLREVPGVTTFRGGVFLQPEAATFEGGGAGRTEVEIDGFVLDPLATASLDLSTIQLGALDHVRIERRMDRLRIILTTLQPEDARPFSRIEAGIGQPRANLFRGLLLTPHLVAGPFGFSVERIEAQGSGTVPRPADSFDTWVKWGVLREDRGVQLEWRHNTLNREPDSEIPLKRTRGDLVIRARNRFAPDLVGEAFYASSKESDEPTSTTIPDSLRTTLKETSHQIGLRGSLERDRFGAGLAIRHRDNALLARWQADLDARLSPIPRVDVFARAMLADWRDRTTREYAASASLRPLDTVRLFGEISSGVAGAPVRGDTLRTGPAFTDRSTWRAGAEITRGRLQAGGAGIHVETDSVAAFGFPGDTANPVVRGGAVTGWEAWARVPLGPEWLSGSVYYSKWGSGARWAFLPASTLRAAVDLHSIPLPSDNLELTGRFEVLQRGVMAAPPPEPGEALLDLPAQTHVNAYIQIRVIEVRLFIRWEDMSGGEPEDLPGFAIRGPRIVYGVKWTFWN